MLYPEWDNSYDGMSAYFKDLLNEKEIAVIDLTWYNYKMEDTLGDDPHPNPSAHKKISQMILDELTSNN